MTKPGEQEAAKARSLGLALLDASRVYEGFVIPSFEGDQRFPPHRRAIIGLVGRQRRFLRAAYTLADTGQVLEAVGLLRSMLEFLVRLLWLAHDPDRNWALWMANEHKANDLRQKMIRQHAPVLHDAAVESRTPEQREEGEAVAAGRTRLAEELGDGRPGMPNLEKQARDVGWSFLYDGVYRYQSNAGPHPTMLAVDLLLEKHPEGLVLRGEPTTQFAAPPVYLHGAWLLYEALKKSGELTPTLNLSELPSFGHDIEALVQEWNTARMPPNWQELLPREEVD